MANPHEAQQLVRSFAERLGERQVCVAVIGDLILDNAIEGVSGGRHPDIGVPLLREATAQENIGGAGNIALTLARLGIDVALFGVRWPSRAPPSCAASPSMPSSSNSPEMRSLYNAESTADARELAARYAREHGQHVYLTLMQEGIVACPAGTRSAGTLIDGYPIDNPHWMGVRDMTAAIVAVGLVLELDPVENARLANPFRSLVAGQRGNGRVFWRDIFRYVGLPE
jgi:sugar/nucleoside kinase (ribokinase family)